ncbi:MAG TPA: hypothetical protein VFL91_01540 [Thermomicrobiales bacterium]|nr:hypothetical protein [Thermomicrobiales bacterium]
MPALSIAVFLLGAAVVASTFLAAVRTFVLPRSARVALTTVVFRAMRYLFALRARQSRSYAERDRAMALYAPISLLVLALTWVILIGLGYTAMFWALGVRPWHRALAVSGSSLFTLGFASDPGVPELLLTFSEAAIGLILVALLISYLPTMYTAFARREAAVTMLEVRAGAPPAAVEAILRYRRIQGLDRLNDLWVTWELWFADIEESHTSLAALAFFRSPQPEHSWITAAGAILDTASLVNAAVDIPHDPQADLCIRAGYLALRHVADYFGIRYNPAPRFPDEPISVTRPEFDDACDRLAAGGVPLKPDRERAWLAFAGWRVNYDTVLLALAALTMAPEAPWSSDRSLRRSTKDE